MQSGDAFLEWHECGGESSVWSDSAEVPGRINALLSINHNKYKKNLNLSCIKHFAAYSLIKNLRIIQVLVKRIFIFAIILFQNLLFVLYFTQFFNLLYIYVINFTVAID